MTVPRAGSQVTNPLSFSPTTLPTTFFFCFSSRHVPNSANEKSIERERERLMNQFLLATRSYGFRGPRSLHLLLEPASTSVEGSGDFEEWESLWHPVEAGRGCGHCVGFCGHGLVAFGQLKSKQMIVFGGIEAGRMVELGVRHFWHFWEMALKGRLRCDLTLRVWVVLDLLV